MEHAGEMVPESVSELGARAGALLKARGETVAVAEGGGGLVSAALLAVPGASAWYLGGTVIYTAAAHRAFLAAGVEAPKACGAPRRASPVTSPKPSPRELGSTWGLAEAGAAGPPNRYGDPAGHAWVAVAGPHTSAATCSPGLTTAEASWSPSPRPRSSC